MSTVVQNECLVCCANSMIKSPKYDRLLVCEACGFLTADMSITVEEAEELYGKDYFHGQEYSDYTRDKKIYQKICMEKLIIMDDDILSKKIMKVKGLKVILEHLTTKEAVQFVEENEIAATITAHHLLMNRNTIFENGINPHNYCLPVLKREIHRQALLEAIKKPSKKFFLGTDSAPHPKSVKETSGGFGGIYSAFAALPLYAEAFEEAGAMENFENFCSKNGADYYGLPYNKGTITLTRESWTVPDEFKVNEQISVVPMRAGREIKWQVK